jgi:hypothetical protein
MNVKGALLAEHIALLFLLVLLVSVVYNGLRREDVREIVKVGLKRGLVFALVSLFVFGFGGYLVAQWLT